MAQPSLDSGTGVILTCGFTTGHDRWAIVLPVATDDNTLNPITLCSDAVNAFVALELNHLMAIFAADTNLNYIQAEGMVDGRVPYRTDIAPGGEPGTLGATSMPRNVSALTAFYVDPGQTLSTGRERVGKTFFAGISADEVVGDIVQNVLLTAITLFCNEIVNGYNTNAGGGKWYRVGKAVRTTATALPNIVAVQVRDYVATQRRRLMPRG